MAMDWGRLLNPDRLGGRPAKAESGRSPYHSDHDKIIFAGAFRRLARKTQVHPLAMNDHVHNRLTHSLEVACVGRSLGVRVGQKLAKDNRLPDGISPNDIGDIVESTCLAHDIGNPPFGHTGEEAIRNWFEKDGFSYLGPLSPRERNDLLTFEGNAQGLRVLTRVENHLNDGGMRLTYATLASFIKYPWTCSPALDGNRPKTNKFGIYTSELDYFHEIAAATGLISKGDDWFCRHPLVHLMESADDFCYGILDLEDGLEMGILEWSTIYKILKPVIPRAEHSELEKILSEVAFGRRTPLVRGKVIGAYVDAAATAFIRHEKEYLNGDTTDLMDLCEGSVKDSVKAAKDLARERIFKHPRKIELEIGAYNVVSTLFELLAEAAFEWHGSPEKLSFRSQRVVDLVGRNTFLRDDSEAEKHRSTAEYRILMRLVDFVGGMTDNYATFLAKQFNGMGQ